MNFVQNSVQEFGGFTILEKEIGFCPRAEHRLDEARLPAFGRLDEALA